MRVIRTLAFIAVAGGAVLSIPQPALACDCHDGGPVCEAFWKTPVVFVGRVESVEALRTTSSTDREIVRFRVTEALRGITARSIDIVNYRTSCHHNFAPGEHWVVYAFPQESGGGLTTHTCTRTAPLEEAAQDVAYGRSSRVLTAGPGRIFGEVSYSRRNGHVAVPRARVTLESERGATISALTDERGLYEFLAPAGRYRLKPLLPTGMTTPDGERLVELSDGRGCARADVHADYPGQVTGRVVNALGRPIPHVTVELTIADGYDFPSSRLRAVTNATGRYAISGVEPGRYAPAVVIGRAVAGDGFEPVYLFSGGTTKKSVARRVEIDGGSQRNAGELVVPKSTRFTQVTGTVVHADGQPASGVKVRTRAASDGNFPWTTVRTDGRGGFSFALVSGLSYRLVAEREDDGGQKAALTFDPSQVQVPLRLTFPDRIR